MLKNVFSHLAVAVECGKSVNKLLCCCGILFAVFQSSEIFVASSLYVLGSLVGVLNSGNLFYKTIANGFLTEIHAVAVLCVVLEEGVSPSGAVTVLINGVG